MVDLIEIIFAAIYIPILITIATYLLYKAIKIKANNVIFISLYFYMIGLDFLFETFYLKDLAYEIFAIFTNTPLILLIFFIKYTFYKEKKSAFKFILVLFIILRVSELILRLPNNFTIPQDTPITESQVPIYYIFEIIVILNSYLVNGWFFYVSFRTYRSLENLNIEPWIKRRYLIISYAILCSAVSTSLSIFIPPIGGGYQGTSLSISIALLKLPFVMSFYFGSLIGWIMPKKLKLYFNKNYKIIEDKEFSEEELMNLIRNQLSEK
ncbi:MAG: hypothetical protein ACFFBP_19560 [Promethearchaeota archaeon]